MREDVIEERTLFEAGPLTVVAQLAKDDHQELSGDYCTDKDRELHAAGAWQYVIIDVMIQFEGMIIVGESLGGVAHGTMGDSAEIDAWEWEKAVVQGTMVQGGSALYDATEDAYRTFRAALKAITGASVEVEGSPLHQLMEWITPEFKCNH